MKPAVTLKQNYEFRRLYQKGASSAGSCMVLYCRKNKLGHNRLGLTASVKLGQKLCDKQGKTVEYPKHELPHGLKWGPEHWDPDYRDNNRKNCYDKGTAPCKTACPAHIAVQGYLKLAAQGRYTDALALIKKDNPFPAVCGRICNKRCEDACTRGTIDQAVSIDAVKKFIAQKDLDAETRYIPPVVIASNRVKTWAQKIAIIGAGKR